MVNLAKMKKVLYDFPTFSDFFGYEDGIESVILKKGCVAVLYKDVDCSSEPFTLKAETNKDLIIKELSESTAKDYGKITINCNLKYTLSHCLDLDPYPYNRSRFY